VAEASDFRDISEAYDVLSDPVRRARYDRERYGSAPPVSARRDVARTRDLESLMAEPIAVTGEPGTARPSFDALFDRLSRNIFGSEQPKAERPEPLDFELILSPDEAARGIVIPFVVPILSTCFQCSGTGRDWVFPCRDCAGGGHIVDGETVSVQVPPGVKDGTVIEVSLEGLGVRNLWLRVHARVELH
jgi:molecular chaperone DnaJ